MVFVEFPRGLQPAKWFAVITDSTFSFLVAGRYSNTSIDVTAREQCSYMLNYILEFICIGLWHKSCHTVSYCNLYFLFCILKCVFLWLKADSSIVTQSLIYKDHHLVDWVRISKLQLWYLNSVLKNHSKTKAKSTSHAPLQGTFCAFCNIISLPLCMSRSSD